MYFTFFIRNKMFRLNRRKRANTLALFTNINGRAFWWKTFNLELVVDLYNKKKELGDLEREKYLLIIEYINLLI